MQINFNIQSMHYIKEYYIIYSRSGYYGHVSKDDPTSPPFPSELDKVESMIVLGYI